MPFSYPRYSLSGDGRLIDHLPSINSADDLRTALNDSGKWSAFEQELAGNDYFYSRTVLRTDVFDHSVIARMIRRAWGQRFLNERTDALHALDGYIGEPTIPRVLGAMLLDFAKKARARGVRPIVILIEDRGYGESLSKMWQDRATRGGVRVMDLGQVHSCSVDDCGQPSGLIVAQGL